jgi:hypothetical protein
MRTAASRNLPLGQEEWKTFEARNAAVAFEMSA